MRPIYRIALAIFVLLLLPVELVPEAQAFRGRGAAFVVGAAAGSASASSAQAKAAAAQQQAASSGKPLALWTVEDSTYSVPIGFGIGQVIPSETAAFNLFVEPQVSVADNGSRLAGLAVLRPLQYPVQVK